MIDTKIRYLRWKKYDTKRNQKLFDKTYQCDDWGRMSRYFYKKESIEKIEIEMNLLNGLKKKLIN